MGRGLSVFFPTFFLLFSGGMVGFCLLSTGWWSHCWPKAKRERERREREGGREEEEAMRPFVRAGRRGLYIVFILLVEGWCEQVFSSPSCPSSLPLSLLLCVSAFVSICLHALSSDLSPTCARACLLCACTRCRTAVCCCAAPRLAPQRHAHIHPQWEPHASPCPASNQRRQPCPSPCSPRYALAFANHTKREVVAVRVCVREGNGEEARCLIVHAYTHMSTPVLRFLCHRVQNCCL